jgi:membrane protease YdiL (CAAX protease family)
MMPFLSNRVPTVVWSGILAFVLTVVAGGIWTVLLISNVATSPAIPWAVVVMALLLWLMWQYLSGKWGPKSTSQARRRYLRARLLSGQVFAWAVVAGVLSIIALVGYWIVLAQLVNIPARVLPNFSGYPLLTVTLVLVMASLVSSLAEEAGFRGYFQGILEHKVSGPVAIVIAALLIAPAHGLTQGFAWPILLWYFFVDVLFGAMAYFTQSILPGILVHSLGLLIFFTLVWSHDAQRRLVWETGANTGFWLAVAQAVVFSTLAILALSQLSRVTKRARDLDIKSPLPTSANEPVG